ncbi:MAG: hypothetical protein KL863_26145 [Rhizobium sp.]|nr:hypothetical protein [Rhizobium sp.]
MDAPLSSILRPGPAAPSNEPTRREPPVEGGDDNARPIDNQGERTVNRTLTDPDAAARQALEAAPAQRTADTRTTLQPPVFHPVGFQPRDEAPVAILPAEGRITATYQPQAAQPLLQQAQATASARPQTAADDMLAGLEEAALRDIGEDVTRPSPTSDDGAAAKERRQARQNRKQKDEDAEPGESRQLTKTERQERRADRLKRQETKGKANGPSLPATTTGRALDENPSKAARKRDKGAKTSTAAPREWGIPWTAISFLIMVLIPAAITTFYYVFIASPQYQVETQFAVRGSSQSSMATMGLGILGGTTTQTGDSYIVTSYVESLQLIRDVQQELGIDLRQFYTRDHIDWMYRIEPDMPLEKFTEYWRGMTDVSFNATTGNTTLYIYAFTAEDSKAIADAVLTVSEKLVNQLSEANRQQVMQVASKQVDRAEERLRKVQAEIRRLRVEEKITDPATLIQLQNNVTSGLQSQLATLKTRLSALLKSVSPEAPQAKALQKQIDAMQTQITEHEAQLGNATTDGKPSLSDEERANLAEVLNKFEELTIEQNFGTQAYTTALAAFETAIVEAQRQERYFATFVAPTRPEIALYPMRYLDSFIAFLVLMAVWMATQFLYRSFRDHAI